MTAPKVIKASYTEIKMVKTRSVYQVVLEEPLEQMEDAIKMLGIPKPGSETWVAVAMLNETAAEGRGGKLAQRAGILCNEGAFNAWAKDAGFEDGKAYIYFRCNVTSRAQLDHNDEAATAFHDMMSEYDLWMRAAA